MIAPIIVELRIGAKRGSAREVLMQDLQAFTCLPLGWEEVAAAAELAWRMARMSHRVPTIDLLIAGTAVVHRYEFWHFGDSHFVATAAAGGPSA